MGGTPFLQTYFMTALQLCPFSQFFSTPVPCLQRVPTEINSFEMYFFYQKMLKTVKLSLGFHSNLFILGISGRELLDRTSHACKVFYFPLAKKKFLMINYCSKNVSEFERQNYKEGVSIYAIFCLIWAYVAFNNLSVI